MPDSFDYRSLLTANGAERLPVPPEPEASPLGRPLVPAPLRPAMRLLPDASVLCSGRLREKSLA